MKGQQSLSDIEYGMRKHKTKREAFLDSMESLINWDKWCGIIEPIYYKRKRGRPPRGIELMLRMYLLQVWFNLSDESTEDSVYDIYAFRKFVGINFCEEQVPDSMTLQHYNVAISHAAKKLMRLIYAMEKSGEPYRLHLSIFRSERHSRRSPCYAILLAKTFSQKSHFRA